MSIKEVTEDGPEEKEGHVSSEGPSTVAAPKLRALSLGAGVQSTVAFLMSCRGELPRLDVAIFADTQRERRRTYAHLEWLESEAKRYGIPIVRWTRGDLGADYLAGCVQGGRAAGAERSASIPVFTRGQQEEAGMVPRQCTREYKIDVIRGVVRTLLGIAPGARVPRGTVVEHWLAEQWFGITTDEIRRLRQAEHWWIRHRYPLVFDVPMSRANCLAWLAKNYPGRGVPRSSCIFCPFHSNAEWRDLRDNDPDEWAYACDFDRKIRHQVGLDGEAFLHSSRVPLDQAPIDDADPRQGLLWNQECLGMCGV